MIDFEKYFVVVRSPVAQITGVDVRMIPARIFSPATERLDAFKSKRSGNWVVLEFDGEFYWRVSLSEALAPDEHKKIAFVTGGIAYRSIRASVQPMNAARIVNSILNRQYSDRVASPRVS